MFYPLLKLDNFHGSTTIHNFSPNNWETGELTDVFLYIFWSNGAKWENQFIGQLRKNESLEICTKNLSNEIFINKVAFIYPSKSKLNENLNQLPSENIFNTLVPSWRATIGIESDLTKVSYQGEMEPFPKKSSLLTFHPFLQYENFDNYLLLLNLTNEPEIIESQIEIYNGFKGKLLDIKSIKTNSVSLIPLNSYNFDKSELPFFINRQTSAIPFGFGYNKDKSIMTLEHTHPPASLVLHGNRNAIQGQIKSKWFNKLTTNV